LSLLCKIVQELAKAVARPTKLMGEPVSSRTGLLWVAVIVLVGLVVVLVIRAVPDEVAWLMAPVAYPLRACLVFVLVVLASATPQAGAGASWKTFSLCAMRPEGFFPDYAPL
jgi:hypothetical protein